MNRTEYQELADSIVRAHNLVRRIQKKAHDLGADGLELRLSKAVTELIESKVSLDINYKPR